MDNLPEGMQYALIIFTHALSFWLLSGAFRARERNRGYGHLVKPVHHNRDKQELFEELHKHRSILELNRLDNLEKMLQADRKKSGID